MTSYQTFLNKSFHNLWDKAAVSNFHGESFTYADVATQIERFHNLFSCLGVQKGDKIALCAKNSARWAISFISATSYGAVAVPLLSEFHPESVVDLTLHSDSVILFTDAEIWARLDKDKLSGLKAVVNCNDFSLLSCRNEGAAQAFATFSSRADKKSFHIDEADGKDLAVINYTSGTTSFPKGVMLRHECFSSIIDFMDKNLPTYPDDRIVSILPMGHIYGLTIECLHSLCKGIEIVYLGKLPSPSLMLEAMGEVKPYAVVAVPLVMEKVYKTGIKPILNRTSVRLALSNQTSARFVYKIFNHRISASFGGKVRQYILGGAAFSPEVDKFLHDCRLPYTVGYGMTEAAPLICWEDPLWYVPGSCGKSIGCCEMKIDSPDPANVTGEILVKGTNVCSGYYKNPQACANLFTKDGYMRTGDLGVKDDEGNVFIKGRSKTMILSSNGQNIYPEEMEMVINAQKHVIESLVVSRNDKLVALVYADKKAIANNNVPDSYWDSLRAEINRKLPIYSQIIKIELIDKPFEKTPKMSIKRFLYQ